MSKSILLIIFLFCINALAEVKISDYKDYKFSNINFKFEEISKSLNYPWGMTFIDDEYLLITEKSGRLVKINILTGKQINIVHDLNILAYGQGGFLDVLYHDNYVYFSIYS